MSDNNDSDHAIPTPRPEATLAGRPLQVAVPNRHLPPVRRKRFRQRLDQRHRAMLAAGAAEAEAEVALALRPIGRQQELQEIDQPRVERRVGRIGLDEGPHRRIAPVARAQRRIPVRVLQEPHVDHHVDAARHAALVGERLQRHREAAARPPPRRTAGAISARRSCGVIARVSISTSARARSGASSATSRSMPTSGRPVRAERVAAPGLAVALQQRGRVAVEIDQHRRAPGRRLDLGRARASSARRPRSRGCAGRCRSPPAARPGRRRRAAAGS